jgi:hypothetical protein
MNGIKDAEEFFQQSAGNGDRNGQLIIYPFVVPKLAARILV